MLTNPNVMRYKLPLFLCCALAFLLFLSVAILFGIPSPTVTIPAATDKPAALNQPEIANPIVVATNDLPNFLMALHACDTALKNCAKPENHSVYLVQSADAINWEIVPGWLPFSGSVPDLVVKDEIAYVYSAGSGSSVTTFDLKNQKILETSKVSVEGITSFVDPAPFLDDQGNIALFFLHCRAGGESVWCFGNNPISSSVSTNAPKEFFIGSATEVANGNGTKFSPEPGDRTLAITGTDPDIFYDGQQHVMYLSYGQGFAVFTSPDLQGQFQKNDDKQLIFLSKNSGGVPSGFYNQSTGQYWSYVHYTRPGTHASVIRLAKHDDLKNQIPEQDWQTIITGESLGLSSTTTIESPGIFKIE